MDPKRLSQELDECLTGHFEGADVRIEQIQESGRLTGAVVWDGFLGKDHVERQRELWEFIRANFERESQLMISAILTYAKPEVADDEAA